MSKEEIIQAAEEYAKKNGFKLNPNRAIVEFIAQGLADNERKFGQRYCPCRMLAGDNKEDSICPCIWHKEDIAKQGRCHCGLFFKLEI